jgi:glycine/D-amino acid oxidase-like deaminating enzyme
VPVQTADVVICGAGIAGVSAAYQLAVRHGVSDVLLVDERPPLTLTSDKSTEAYRNWWPGPDDAMVRLMNRSIDLIEQLADDCDNRFLLNRRGYLWVTGDPHQAEQLRSSGVVASDQGAGELRVHAGRLDDPPYRSHRADGWTDQPGGADLILDRTLLHRTFPFLAESACAALHTRRCGWLSGQQFGMEQLERARAAGARLVEGRVEEVLVDGGRVSGVRIAGPGGSSTVSTRCFVNAAGPFLGPVAAMLDVKLPVFSELHLKVSIEDPLGIVPRDAPLLTWQDPQHIAWSDDERELLAADEHARWLTGQMPGGVHLRPEGRNHLLILWPYHAEPVPETFPIDIPEEYAEVCLRGITAMVPGLSAYLDPLPRPYIDGGYYTKTRENRPIAGPLPVAGAWVHGALSGFGLMAASATSELLALHVTGGTLPDYAPAFTLKRYQDPGYLRKLEDWGDTVQL